MKYLKYALLGVSGIVLLLLIWGVAIEPRLIDVQEETASIPQLPRGWEGKRVALIADFQVGMWLDNEGTTRRIVERLIKERPAGVLIAGDFVYKPTDDDHEDVEQEDMRDFAEEVNKAVALVRPLVEASIPTYAVLGNHDYGMMYPSSVKNGLLARHVRASLEAAGVRVLENEAVPLKLPEGDGATQQSSHAGSALYLIGIDSEFANNAKPQVALAQLPDGAARIAFMHNPDSFAKFPANTAPLALAGHTHGGQIRLPFLPEWSWMSLASKDEVHADGWIDGYGQPGNRLYVNRGIGLSYFPARINCPPELTLFTLRRAS